MRFAKFVPEKRSLHEAMRAASRVLGKWLAIAMEARRTSSGKHSSPPRKLNQEASCPANARRHSLGGVMMNGSPELIPDAAIPDAVGCEAQLLDGGLAIVGLLMVVTVKSTRHA